ncbi:MAG TPA: hypothetical protein VMH61_00200 [Candidatus Acidoferrales bacterium]|nr:hypothetical protein [Candidatus Acidoferrales bacterium]
MRNRLLIVVLLALAAVAITTCSKSTSSTNPYGGGGGGGGGGPSFNLTFPATNTSQEFTFSDSGSWGYRCAVHGSLGMTGTVDVTVTAAAESAVVGVGVNSSNAPALSYNPPTVSIKPGGYVRWVNLSSMTNHTVTRP